MDTLHFCIAIIPVSVYLLLIGLINLSPRPFLTTGTRDLAALALAVSGFAITGPMELFLPESAASILRGWVWLPLLLLYVILVTLAMLLMRPRLIIYNVTADRLQPLLEQVVSELDAASRWAGNSVEMPNLGVQLAVESYAGMRNTTLSSISPDQDLDGWHRLRERLQTQLATAARMPVNPRGFSFLLLAMRLAVGIVYLLLTDKQEIAQAVRQMLRM